MDLFDLAAKITLDDSGFNDKLGGISKGIAGFAAAGAAGFAAAGAAVVKFGSELVQGVGEVAEYGDNIDKMSQKLGLSAEAYQKWDYVLGQSGTSIDSVQTGIKTLTNKLDDAKNGSASAQEMFAKLGLSMDDLSTMSREDVFGAVITGFQQMGDSTERAALANDLFGKSGQELAPLFNASTESTQELMAAAEDLGFVMSNDSVKASAAFQDSLDTMQRTIGGLKNSMLSEFMPSLTTVMDGLTQVFSGNSSEGLGLIQEGIGQFVENLETVFPRVAETGTQILIALGDGILSSLPMLFESAIQIIMQLGTAIISNLPMILETALQIILSLALGISTALPELIPTVVDIVLQLVDTLIANVGLLIDAAIAIIIGLAEGLINSLPSLLSRAPEIVASLVNAIIENAPKLLSAALQLIIMLANGLMQNIGQMLSKGAELVSGVVSGIKSAISKMVSVGFDIVRGLWSGIQNARDWLVSKITGFFNGVVNNVKSFLGIRSPSKVFAQIGGFMAEGVGVGWEKAFGGVEDDIVNSLDFSKSYKSPYATMFDGIENKLTAAYSVAAVSMKDQLEQMKIYLSTGELVGGITPRMNYSLGNSYVQDIRGAMA